MSPFVVEEAQSVIGGQNNVGKFVELAKEGRKYNLGAIFITQQPGSISRDILSQGDNYFIFHLLNKGDLRALQDANAHFSNDILTQILNEPIKGKAYMWTSDQPFVLPVKILNFESIAEPDMSKTIQKSQNLLGAVLSEITTFNEIEKQICEKTYEIIDDMGIDISKRTIIFSESTKKAICKGLYKKLTASERKYLDDNKHVYNYDKYPDEGPKNDADNHANEGLKVVKVGDGAVN